MALNLGDDLLMQKSGGPLLGSGIEAGLEATVKKRYDEAMNIVLREKVIFLPASSFVLSFPAASTIRADYDPGGAYAQTTDESDQIWLAPLVLEKGATITEVTLFANLYAGEASRMELFKGDTVSGPPEDYLIASGMSYVNIAVKHGTIDTENFNYYIKTTACYVAGARVKYKL